MTVPDGEALRHNTGKLRYDLIPPDFMDNLAALFTSNLDTYPERNWERGMAWSKCFASLMRHSWAWFRGQDMDPKTGHHHMLMAAWNCMALAVYARRRIGLDDRPIRDREPAPDPDIAPMPGPTAGMTERGTPEQEAWRAAVMSKEPPTPEQTAAAIKAKYNARPACLKSDTVCHSPAACSQAKLCRMGKV